MAYVIALVSAISYGAGDFVGGLTARRASTLAIVFLSHLAGLLILAAILPWLPAATASPADLAWGAAAGLAMLAIVLVSQAGGERRSGARRGIPEGMVFGDPCPNRAS